MNETWTVIYEDFDGSTTKELVESFGKLKGLRNRVIETRRGKLGIFYLQWHVCVWDRTVRYRERRRMWLTGKEAGKL